MEKDADRPGAPVRPDAAHDDSDFEDSLLKQVVRVPVPMRRPMPGERLGGADGRRFEIPQELGGGAMGLAQLDHENIVRIFDEDVWSGQPWEGQVPFLVMECLEGESLASLPCRGPLDVRRALSILCAVVAGLAQAHERHIVHRDLKPSNVFLPRRGGVKLLDFGLAWLMAWDASSLPLLPTSGTPPYMAPEQWKGEPQDERTDLCPWREEPRTLHPGRRQVTLVGCWLTGPAGLGERLDPEDFGEVRSAFHRACSRVIQEYGGSVTLFMGDEVSACFGHPQAREDDSECAARAGLKLLGAIREALCERLPFLDDGPCLAVKVGIHTDTVVFDDIPPDLQGRTPAIQGEAPRIALGLARQGEPNTVSLSGTTSTRVHGSFQTQPLGVRGYEGLTGRREVEVHRLLRERKAVLRFSRSHGAGGLSRFVGRQRELRQLLGVWDGVLAGRGAFVVVSGEAGIGKSRLIEELRRRVPPTSALRLQCQCWSQFTRAHRLSEHLVALGERHHDQRAAGAGPADGGGGPLHLRADARRGGVHRARAGVPRSRAGGTGGLPAGPGARAPAGRRRLRAARGGERGRALPGAGRHHG